MTCKTHPDAPHGFVRGASHSEDRYVCECEFWEEPKMNERIRELSEQAKNYAESKMQLTGVKDSAAYDKMFAELIVRECARLNLELSYELAGVIVDTEEGIGFDSVCLNTVKQVHNSLASRQLIEHFGVEL